MPAPTLRDKIGIDVPAISITRSRRVLFIASVCTVLGLLAVGCGGGDPAGGAEPAAATAPPEDNGVVSSDPRIQYFHEQLVINGEDIQSEFGGFLLTLKMHARDLQQDDPKHAYDTVLDEVRKVQDPEMRRQMAQTFFNTADVP